MTDLEKRIEVLEAKDAIKELKALYCEIADDSHNPDRMVNVFTEDGIFEGEGLPKTEGREALHALFSMISPIVEMSHHMTMNPIITVDGDTATGKWYFFGAFKYASGERKWMANHYEETYAKTADGWKIKHLKAPAPLFDATFEKGW